MTEPRLFSTPRDPRKARVEQAQRVLDGLNFEKPQTNERAALVLLALLGLTPETPWAEATAPLLGINDIMNRARDHYHKDWKPNTRETVRRQTVHQFVAAALVVHNPDDPGRATNSDKSCYQIEPRALELLRCVENDDYEYLRRVYLTEVPGLKAQYAKARDLQRVPVTMPDGTNVTLSPGGQTPLLKQIIDEFCSRYTPGGQVLYVGDTGAKWMIFEREKLQDLGVTIESHGKMCDLVVYMPDKDWLILLEACSTHGPVDAKRYNELKSLFASAQPGLVFVSCFPDRAKMRRYLSAISWETEVWCADSPTHLIHFNGERFLGPYQ